MQEKQSPMETGNPVDDPRAFRRTLGQFATGVTVLTAQHKGHLAGMAVNSFAALSLDPPLVLWSIRRQSGSLPTFSQASHFAVNVLWPARCKRPRFSARPSPTNFPASPGNRVWAARPCCDTALPPSNAVLSE